jgi:branched-chain amino acid aminotransferase
VTVGAPELASVDGVVGPTATATIALKDDGLYRGDGVFEVIRIYDGRPFRLADHLDRLTRSASSLELTFDRPALETEIGALLAAAGTFDGQLRLIMTRGGRRIAATEPVPVHAETVTVASVEYQTTIILNGVKSLSYGANMQATRIAKAAGADEALLVRPDGVVLEPPTSTIFWVADGVLRTPSLDNAILASITRERIIAMTAVEEGSWSLEELIAAEEAFLASTTREIQAVASIDGAALPAAPGPRTRQVQSEFTAMLRDELAGQ